MSEPPPRLARVVRLDARGCLVRLDEPVEGLPDEGRSLWCGVRGRIHLRDRRAQKSPVVVGDVVDVVQTAPERGAVVAIHPRETTLSRPAIQGGRVEHVMAANVDRVVIVSSLRDPEFNPGLVDRILAVVEFSHLQATIVVNKVDLAAGALPAELETYEGLGYEVLRTSAEDGTGLAALRDALRGHRSVVCGHSGVGKSSLLNALAPDLGLRVGNVNVVTRRGRHTTTASVWLPFGENGAVVDTAGVREFGLYGIPPRDVPWLFRDLAKIAPGCRYPDCSHVHEPDCAVMDAAESGELAVFRYESYLRILESLDDR